ncbi:hypothetical protein BHE74_00019604 [Ensete ventricosum]|nr:hypothetical protein BHE74_00019604 [Ensete ventricosum]RZS16301.1 hypothetical protein BHM03_00048270 [Ensete ventricosum]
MRDLAQPCKLFQLCVIHAKIEWNLHLGARGREERDLCEGIGIEAGNEEDERMRVAAGGWSQQRGRS